MEDTISFQRIVFKRINRHNVFRNRLTFHAQNHQILFFFKKSGKGEFRFRTNQHICLLLLALSQSERVNLYYFRLNMYFTKLTIVKVMVAQAQVCWLVENEMPCVFPIITISLSIHGLIYSCTVHSTTINIRASLDGLGIINTRTILNKKFCCPIIFITHYFVDIPSYEAGML